eukprot:6255331-Pyramimonas_sp.AAC.1
MPALLWAARYNRKWFRELKKCDDMFAMSTAHVLKLSEVDGASSCWLLLNVHARSATMAKCKFDDSTATFAICTPPETKSSLHMFAQFHETCMSWGKVTMSVHEHEWADIHADGVDGAHLVGLGEAV